MIDPSIIAAVGTLGGGVVLKMTENHMIKKRERQISEKFPDGYRLDEFGFRVDYDPHYTRTLEKDTLGYTATPCGCDVCEEEQRQQDREDRYREQLLKDLERAKRKREVLEKNREIISQGGYDHLTPNEIKRSTYLNQNDIANYLGSPVNNFDVPIRGKQVNVKYSKKNSNNDSDEFVYEKIIFTAFPHKNTTTTTEITREEFLANSHDYRPLDYSDNRNLITDIARLNEDIRNLNRIPSIQTFKHEFYSKNWAENKYYEMVRGEHG